MAAAEADKARKTEAKNKAEIEEEKRKKENLFNLRYHQDMTDHTEVQGMLRELREQQDAQRSANEARGAVLGETKEQQIAEENGMNKAFADSVANIASNASALKDGYLNDYENSLSKYYQDKREHNSRMSQIEMNGSNQWAQAANNAFGAAASAAGVAAGAAEGAKAPSKAPSANTPGSTPNKIQAAGPVKIGDNGMQLNPDGTITNPTLNPWDRIQQDFRSQYSISKPTTPNWSQIYGYGGGWGVPNRIGGAR